MAGLVQCCFPGVGVAAAKAADEQADADDEQEQSGGGPGWEHDDAGGRHDLVAVAIVGGDPGPADAHQGRLSQLVVSSPAEPRSTVNDGKSTRWPPAVACSSRGGR